MLTRLRRCRALQTIIVGATAVATVAPAAYAFYRCPMMGEAGKTLFSPCCGDDADQSDGQDAQLQSERCCVKVTVALERAPSEIGAPERSDLPAVAADRVVLASSAPPVAPIPSAWTRADFDSGTPILLQTCSLLL
jgi:hypothetical protein